MLELLAGGIKAFPGRVKWGNCAWLLQGLSDLGSEQPTNSITLTKAGIQAQGTGAESSKYEMTI